MNHDRQLFVVASGGADGADGISPILVRACRPVSLAPPTGSVITSNAHLPLPTATHLGTWVPINPAVLVASLATTAETAAVSPGQLPSPCLSSYRCASDTRLFSMDAPS
jgi:hypothetical protein